MTAPLTNLEKAALLECDVAFLEAFGRERFRGGIAEYGRTVRLFGDYRLPPGHCCRNCRAEGLAGCHHFEVDTCRQLEGPLKAILDVDVEMVMLLKSPQTLGSLAWDMSLHYFVVHGIYTRIKVFLDCGEKVTRYCRERLMPVLKANPDIAPLLPSGELRFENNTTCIKFTNGVSLEVLPLNETSTSSLPADCVIIDEGWLAGNTGLMAAAIERAKQANPKKLIIIGQASDKKEDQDKLWEKLHVRVPLSWACPCCGGRQSFGKEPLVKRPEEFKVLEPKPGFMPVPAAPKPGTWAGMKIRVDLVDLKTPEMVKAACKDAYLECYHCGYEILDTPANRSALQDTYEQEYQIQGVTPPKFMVGFWNPDPASVTVPFAETMEEWVSAKKAREDFGDALPLKEFYKKRWATPWDENTGRREVYFNTAGSYEADPDKLMPDSFCRNLVGDVQQNQTVMDASGISVPGWLWFVAREWDKHGNSIQLERGFVRSWKEFDEVRRKWKIPCSRTYLDCAHWTHEVAQKAAEFAERVESPRAPGGFFMDAWRLLKGDDRASFEHDVPDGRGGYRKLARPYSPKKFMSGKYTHADGRVQVLAVVKVDWSKISIGQQLDMLRSGQPGLPKFESLPRSAISAKMQEIEVKDLTYEQQMSSQEVDMKPSGKQFFRDLRPDSHYLDCERMQDAVANMDGLLGSVAV